MSIITITAQVTEDNTRTFTNKKGQEQLILNTQILPKVKDTDIKAVYGSAFLPPFIKYGDIVTVSGEVQAGSYTNKQGEEVAQYNFNFPTVSRAYVVADEFGSQADAQADLFGSSQPMDVTDDDLPF